jgi:hypothetical protein
MQNDIHNMKKLMDKNKIGSIITFGNYKWRILDIKDNTALIITEDIIEQRPYHDVYKDITWADCLLRKYLNGEFCDKFNATDKSRIIPVLNSNPDNQWYGANGGADTQDSVFLLTIEDAVCKFFGDSSANLHNRSKSQKYWFNKKDANNGKRAAKFENRVWWWWLRSPGRINRAAVYIHGDGNVGINGNSVYFQSFGAERDGGVRPALWLKLE